MTLADQPVWIQKLYWYFHGPIGNVQPRGANYMGASGVVSFLVIEAILGICILLGLFGIDWLGATGTLNKCLKALIIVAIGGAMLIKLLNFAGA
jgi:hypothetical protein